MKTNPYTKPIAIFGIIQVAIITYAVLATGMLLKMRSEEAQIRALLESFKSAYILLYLIPLVWTAFASYVFTQQKFHHHAADLASGTWLVSTLALIFFAGTLTLRSFEVGSLDKVKEEQSVQQSIRAEFE
jgi:hypothetical protein